MLGLGLVCRFMSCGRGVVFWRKFVWVLLLWNKKKFCLVVFMLIVVICCLGVFGFYGNVFKFLCFLYWVELVFFYVDVIRMMMLNVFCGVWFVWILVCFRKCFIVLEKVLIMKINWCKLYLIIEINLFFLCVLM